jgi:endoribonuclease Nob1
LKNSVSRVESKFALDATAFYQGFHLRFSSPCITTGLVFEEISHIQNKLSTLENLILNKRIIILEPNNNTVRFVKSSAKQIGESRLTEADISILALAKDYSAILVTDDFAVCNLGRTIRIGLLNLGTKGIRDTRKWMKFCSNCGRGYPSTQLVCSICGNKLRIRYKKLINSKVT